MKLTWDSEKMIKLALCLFAAYAAMLLPVDAMATTASVASGVSFSGGGGSGSSGDPIGGTLHTVVCWFTGTIGQGIATLAIIIIGVGALMGKVSWGMAIIVGIGVAVIFGAPAIVNLLSTGAGAESC